MPITREQAVYFGKLQNKEIDIVDEVWLKTTHVADGRVIWSGPMEREFLESWLDRATAENSQDCVKWVLCEEKGECDE